MMDPSGVIDAMLTLGGVVGVLMTAICTLSLQSTTVSTSSDEPSGTEAKRGRQILLPEAA